MKFKVEWLEGYGDAKPRICTLKEFTSEHEGWDLEDMWGDKWDKKLNELKTSKVGQKVTLVDWICEYVVATRLADDVEQSKVIKNVDPHIFSIPK